VGYAVEGTSMCVAKILLAPAAGDPGCIVAETTPAISVRYLSLGETGQSGFCDTVEEVMVLCGRGVGL
jgi:hypothetical protein